MDPDLLEYSVYIAYVCDDSYPRTRKHRTWNLEPGTCSKRYCTNGGQPNTPSKTDAGSGSLAFGWGELNDLFHMAADAIAQLRNVVFGETVDADRFTDVHMNRSRS